IKLLEEKLSLTQKYLSKKDFEIMSLKAELVNIKIELDFKISKLKYLKLEDILIFVIGENSEKNISKSRLKGKIMNKVKKISTDILTHTNDKIVSILESSKIDTKITSKPDYIHSMTASSNLFSGIYKPTMNEQKKLKNKITSNKTFPYEY
ncbi:19080_t:CDS:2, partial [Cetraspora pellucida]